MRKTGYGVGSVLLLIMFSSVLPAAALETVFVVRHAQKDLDEKWDAFGDARPLSHKGVVCASRLAALTSEAGVAAVYSTERVRTLATGAAVSGGLAGVDIIGVNEEARPSSEFVADLRQRHREDRAILLVGHSNTVTDIVVAFRADTATCLEPLGLAKEGIQESQYGDLWEVELEGGSACSGAVSRRFLGDAEGVDCATP